MKPKKSNPTKEYGRVCGRCNNYHVIKRINGIRPYHGAICPSCKVKSYNKKFENFKEKNRLEWKKSFLKVLKGKEKLKISEIANSLVCSCYAVRERLRALSDDKDIKIFWGRPALVWI